MVLQNYTVFLDSVFKKLDELRIDISKYELDHIGYQASSNEDYDKLKPEFEKIGDLLSEEIVGGRRVGIFKLKKPLPYKGRTIPAIELVAPKTGQVCPSALEHIELVITETFKEFLQKYSNIEMDSSLINQETFPMIKLKLGENLQVKFHLTPVLEIIGKQSTVT